MPRPITEAHTGLHVLVDNSCEHEDAVDIVAIHGRGAHPADTWCQLRNNAADKSDPKSYIDWLQDETMLPSVVAHARILRYGYESAWFSKDRINTSPRIVSPRLLNQLLPKREKCPKRPLIFISHSFGGLIVLKVLIDSYMDKQRWQDIYDSTIGLVFFGTPFRGSEKLTQEKIVQLAELNYGPDKVLGNALSFFQAGEESLTDLVDNYHRIAWQGSRPKVACFYEQKFTNVAAIVDKEASLDTVWVNESSGTLDGSESVEKYSRACDHFAMNKFYSPEQEDFKTLARVVQEMVQEGSKLLARRRVEHVVKVGEGELAENHPDRLASQHNLASAYQANGQVREAVRLLEHVAKVEEGELAENHPSRLASQHMLAIAYQANGQVTEAVQLLEHVVKVREGELAENHPDRLASEALLEYVLREAA